MIISRTPFRISLFGGGTDYSVWFEKYGGQVLGFAIDKYCYLSARKLPPFFSHKSRIVYSKEEWVNYHKDIQHPAVRECLRYLDVRDGVEICHQSDLLARKGIGSSGAFVVGLLNALGTMMYAELPKKGLAREAIRVEQEYIKESVGCQDQYLCALGGFNHLYFNRDGTVKVNLIIPPFKLLSYLMLFDTGTSRVASEIAKKQIEATPNKTKTLKRMYDLVDEALKCIKEERIEDIGYLLDENWQLKRSLTDAISTPQIDEIYKKAKQAGATGGKLLGAGGGGYILFFVPPEHQTDIKRALYDLRYIPFDVDNSGTQIIFNDEQY